MLPEWGRTKPFTPTSPHSPGLGSVCGRPGISIAISLQEAKHISGFWWMMKASNAQRASAWIWLGGHMQSCLQCWGSTSPSVFCHSKVHLDKGWCCLHRSLYPTIKSSEFYSSPRSKGIIQTVWIRGGGLHWQEVNLIWSDVSSCCSNSDCMLISSLASSLLRMCHQNFQYSISTTYL